MLGCLRDNVRFLTVGIILMVTKFFDTVTDVIFGAYIDKDILDLGSQFGVFAVASMDSGPAKNPFNDAFWGMDINSF